jgi:hypothetical protein
MNDGIRNDVTPSTFPRVSHQIVPAQHQAKIPARKPKSLSEDDMSTSTPIASSSTSHLPVQPSKGPKSRYQQNNAKYGTPLPIPLPNNRKQSTSKYLPFSILPNFLAPSIDFITCTGVYDATTRCVVVEDRGDMEILFRRGFFGKGTLSRSEPSWRDRRVDILKGGECEFVYP